MTKAALIKDTQSALAQLRKKLVTDAKAGRSGKGKPPRGAAPQELPAPHYPAPLDAAEIGPVAVGRIAAWPDNPRKFSDDTKFAELVQMVQAKGVLQNIVLRPHPDPDAFEAFQIVCGERRWRAAIRAGLEYIPAAVRILTDQEAFEVAVVENVGREDMSPVDEAFAYQRMTMLYKYSAEDVAAKVAKPVGYIHQRLVLCRLVPQALEWFRNDRFTLGGLIELARVETALQERYLRDMEEKSHMRDDTGTLNALTVRYELRSNYLNGLKLNAAPFDIQDPELVPAAGACHGCPKNTAAQRHLFGESSEEAAVCLDGACWRSKVDAACTLAVAGGARLVEGEEAAKLVTAWGRIDPKAKLKELTETCYADAGRAMRDPDEDGRRRSGYRTYSELLTPALAARPSDLVLVRSPSQPDKLLRCVRQENVQELLKAAGHEKIADAVAKDGRHEKSAADKKAIQKQKAEERARREAMVAVGAYVTTALLSTLAGADSGELDAVIREVTALAWTKDGSAAAERRGLGREAAERWGDKKIGPEPRLESMKLPELLGFLVELLVEDVAGGQYPPPRVERLFEQVPGLHWSELQKRHLQELRGKEKAKKGKGAAAPKKAKKGKSE